MSMSRPSRPDRRTILPARGAGSPNCFFFLFLASEAATCIFQHSSFQKVILDELFGFSLLRCLIGILESGLGPENLPFEPELCTLRLCSRLSSMPSPILETTMRGLLQLDLLKHWNESTHCKDVSTSIQRSSMRILRDGEMDHAECPPVRGSPRTKNPS